jgi:hypothetical protein
MLKQNEFLFWKVSLSINRDYSDSFQNMITILNVLYGEIEINLTYSYD